MKNNMKTNILLPLAVLSVLLIGFVMLFGMAGVRQDVPTAEALDNDYFEQKIFLEDSGTFDGTNIHWRVEVLSYIDAKTPQDGIISVPN